MSRTLSGSVSTQPKKTRKVKLNVSQSNDAIWSGESTSLSRSPAHPISSQGTSDISPVFDVLLATSSEPADKDRGYRTESAHILAPTPRRILPNVDLSGVRVSSDGSKPTHSSMSTELTPNDTSTWSYSRDPLHNRYPDFSKFFSPMTCDTFSPMASATMDNTWNFPGIDYTVQSPDYIPATTHSPVSPVSFRTSLSLTHTPHAEQASGAPQDRPVVELQGGPCNDLTIFKSLQYR